MEDALSECSGNTLIISNELVDAFPVELIQWSKDENKWHKLMVQLQNESWTITRGDEYKTKPIHQFLTLRILTMAKSLNDMMNLFHGLTVGVIFGT